MFLGVIVLAALTLADSKPFADQVALDQAGFSCNTIDGQWGRKSDRALACYTNRTAKTRAQLKAKFRTDVVTEEDLAAVAPLPGDPAARANLDRMGYETVKEMFAERGHLSQIALARLNPGIDWEHLAVGTRILLPDFPSIAQELVSPRERASLVRISLTNFEVTVYDSEGKVMALFPCSIAKNKAKLPRTGELKIVSAIAHPNYTYTPDYTPPGKKVKRYVWPEGENCPIGVAWLGLNLPGYGIHGTPKPESIGRAESHGCFRLANWNAARLYSMCPVATRIIIDP